jgi:aspartyl aminopeptidase
VFINKPDVGMGIKLKIPINLVGRHIDSLRCSAKESQEFELPATA